MYLWFVLTVTVISHIGLIILFEKQRKKIDSLRHLVRRQKNAISNLESQVRLASRRLFK